MSSLKADVGEQIVKSGFRVTGAGDLKVAGWYLDYSDEGVHGRIEMRGKLTQGNCYRVLATLSELSTFEGPPQFGKIIRGGQPEGYYHVVPIRPEKPGPTAKNLLKLGKEIIQRSVENIKQELLAGDARKSSLLAELEYVEVYVWHPIPIEVQERLKRMMAEWFETPVEYEQYKEVYFLNDVALRMYREAGAEIGLLKTISADEVPKMAGPSLRGPYLPEKS